MMHDTSSYAVRGYGSLRSPVESFWPLLRLCSQRMVPLLVGLILSAYATVGTADTDNDSAAELGVEEAPAANHPPADAVPDPSADMTVEEILQRDPEASDYGEAPRCLSTRRIRSTQVLDDQHVLIEVGRDQHYLVQFKYRCPMLRRGEPVIYEPTGNRLCEKDALRGVIDQGLGDLQPGPRCSIPSFQSMNEAQVVQLKESLKSNRERERAERKAKKKREREAKRRARERDAETQKNKQVSVPSSPTIVPGSPEY